MIISILRFSHLFIISFCLIFSVFTSLHAQIVSESDSLALVALYNSTNGDNWTRNDNWLVGPVDTWYGIFIENDSVNRIDLYYNNLSGSLPSDIGNIKSLEQLSLGLNQLTGNIPSELGTISNLQELYLPHNQLEGNIPVQLGNLSTLEILHLGGNKLTGNIPSQISMISSLRELDLEGNQLVGNIPDELSLLSNLTTLNLSHNQLTGNIPFQLRSLDTLITLNLSHNQLIDTIPSDLENLAYLKFLNLGYNQLSGNIPEVLGNLLNLQWLALEHNQLSGNIPEALGNLINLQGLQLHYNELTDSIPSSLGSLSKLTTLDIRNNQLTGSIPDSFTNLSNIQILLSFNNFTELPDFSNSNIIILSAGQNQFTFEDILPNIPIQNSGNFYYSPQWYIGNEKIINLSLGESHQINLDIDTAITDNIYTWFKNDIELTVTHSNKLVLKNLTIDDAGLYTCQVTNPLAPNLILRSKSYTINVELPDGRSVPETDSLALVALYNSTNGHNWNNKNNWLIGRVDTWYGISTVAKRVTEIKLMSNNLTGVIPPELSGLDNLIYLNLGFNKLTESIPYEIGDLHNLESIYLQVNELHGNIPIQIGNLKNLRHLDLSTNQFTGIIPQQIGQNKKLQSLQLHGNQLTGEIPVELAELIYLEDLNLYRNQLSGYLPPELAQMTSLRMLHLARNQFKGNIPAEYGSLVNLEILLLFNNLLSGNLPSELGNLKKLRSLDLSNNQFTGNFPMNVIRDLTTLRALNLSYNQFTGAIPNELGKKTLYAINLSNNQLSGELPQELDSLKDAYQINLSNNQLSGTIPPMFGSFENLQHLILSSNNFTGTLPPELGNINNLETLRLNNNQLEGTVPDELTALINIDIIDLSNNQINNIPDFSTLAHWDNLSYKGLNVQSNKLSFEDILPNLSLSTVTNFKLLPQDSIGQTKTVHLQAGESYTINLSIDSTLTTNEYRWFKDSVEIAVTHQNSFTITDVTPEDAGVYTCEVTNPAVDSLTLYSRPVTLVIKTEPIPQTITFDSIPDKTLGDAPFALSASASSGLPVSFTVEGTALLDGNVLTLTDTGKVTITAVQPGNENYQPAEEVVRSFLIKAATFTLSGKVKTEANGPAGSGAVILYTPNEADRLTIFQTGVLQTDGSYAFTDLKAGDYSVGVIPDDVAFLTTYLGDVVIRSEATLILLSQNTENQNIKIISQTETLTGNASISGILILEENNGGSRIMVGTAEVEGMPLPEVAVYLINASGDVVAHDVTDAEGKFSFTNVAAGSYQFKADYEGMSHDTDNFTIEVSENDMEVSALVAQEGIVRVQEVSVVTGTIEEVRKAAVLLYPNPTEGKFSILVDTHWVGGSLIIHNMHRQSIVQKLIHSAKLTFDMSQEKAGVYVVTLQKGESWQMLRVSKF